MKFVEFQRAFSSLPVIPVVEIEKQFPGFDPNALTRWQQKGYLEKIRNGYYRLTHLPLSGDLDLFFIANRIYHPSYISLQSALRWYDFIPEGVFTVTSVSTRKSQTYSTPHGDFSYRKIKQNQFWGYGLEPYQSFQIKIADPAKALLDLLYFYPQLSTGDDFYELRLDKWEVNKRLDWEVFDGYVSLFPRRHWPKELLC